MICPRFENPGCVCLDPQHTTSSQAMNSRFPGATSIKWDVTNERKCDVLFVSVIEYIYANIYIYICVHVYIYDFDQSYVCMYNTWEHIWNHHDLTQFKGTITWSVICYTSVCYPNTKRQVYVYGKRKYTVAWQKSNGFSVMTVSIVKIIYQLEQKFVIQVKQQSALSIVFTYGIQHAREIRIVPNNLVLIRDPDMQLITKDAWL